MSATLVDPSVLSSFALRACAYTNASGAAIAAYSSGLIECIARSGVQSPAVGYRFDPRGLAGLCLLSGEPLRCTDASVERAVVKTEAAQWGSRSVAMTPLRRGEDVWGILAIFSAEPNAFSDETCAILETVAGKLAVMGNLLSALSRSAEEAPGPEDGPAEAEAAPAPRTTDVSVLEQSFELPDTRTEQIAEPEIEEPGPIAPEEEETPEEDTPQPTFAPVTSTWAIQFFGTGTAAPASGPQRSKPMPQPPSPVARPVAPKPEVHPAPHPAAGTPSVVAATKLMPLNRETPPSPLTVAAGTASTAVTRNAPHTPTAQPAQSRSAEARRVQHLSMRQTAAHPRAAAGAAADRKVPAPAAASAVPAPAPRVKPAVPQRTIATDAQRWLSRFSFDWQPDMNDAADWVREHGRTLSIGAGAVVLVLAATLLLVRGGWARRSLRVTPSTPTVQAAPPVAAQPQDAAAQTDSTPPPSEAPKPTPSAAAAETATPAAPVSAVIGEAPKDARLAAAPAPPPLIAVVSPSSNRTVTPALPRVATAPPPVDTAIHLAASHNTPAELVQRVMPIYPPAARLLHTQGTAVLDLTVQKDGHVTDVKWVSGNTVFKQAAINAVRQWKYKPATLDAHPVSSSAEVDLKFGPQ